MENKWNVTPKKRNGFRINNYWLIFALLLCLVLCFSTSLISARFVSVVESTSNTSIATFDITTASVSPTELSVDLQSANQKATFSFDIIGNSDVTFSYSVKVVLPSHSVSGLVIRIGDQSQAVTPGVLEYMFSNVNEIPYGNNTDTCTLIFDATNVTEDVVMNGITVVISAEQVD